MESKQRNKSDDQADEASGMMSTTTNEEQPVRKIAKAKRRVKND